MFLLNEGENMEQNIWTKVSVKENLAALGAEVQPVNNTLSDKE